MDTFKSLRGANYANVMMTGNIKNAAYILTKGLYEKNKELILIGRNTLIIIMTFILGVICSSFLSYRFGEMALMAMLLPLGYVNYLLLVEHLYIQRKIKPIVGG
ncbi:permease [Streptococcus pseudoporcinus]|uniref:Permease n=1 Tax=Streptococcus pseudoporcinus TaxID=361101 RepID=A0A4U9Z8B5_9STRE|nr:permease [Streptococcus pseudoporcinus]